MQTTEQSTALSIFRRNIRAETSPTTTTLTQFPVLSSFDCHMRCCCSSDWMRQVISASDRTLSISVSSINGLTNSCGWCGAALQLSSFAPCLQSADVQPEGAITIKPDELSVLSVTVLSGPPLVCDVRRDRLGSVPHTHTHTWVTGWAVIS